MRIEINVAPGVSESLVGPLETCIEGLDGIEGYDIDTGGRTVVVVLDLGARPDDAEFEQGVAAALDACLETLEGINSWNIS